MLENTEFRHLYYNFIRNIVQQRESGQSLLESRLTNPITVFYALRGLLIIWTMMTNYRNTLWPYEYLLCFAHTDTHLYDSLLATSIIFIAIFIVKARKGFINSPLSIWKYFYDIVVRNTDYGRQCRKSEREIGQIQKRKIAQLTDKLEAYSLLRVLVPRRIRRFYYLTVARLTIWKNLDNINLKKMARHQIVINENAAPLELRIKLLLAVDLIDRACFVIQIFIYCLYVVFFLTYVPAFFRSAPMWYHIPLIIIDFAGIFYAFPFLIRCACIYSVCSFTGNLIYTYKLKACEVKLEKVLQSSRQTGSSHAQVVANTLEQCLTEHTRVCTHILYGNSKIWSTIMFYFLSTNVPSNVYFGTHILFDKLPLMELIIYVVLMCTQLIAATFVLLRLAKNSKLIHSITRYLPAIQQMLHGRQCRFLKLKLDHLMFRLTSSKYGMSVGCVFLVTYESVFNILLLYVYYLLFAYLFRKSHEFL